MNKQNKKYRFREKNCKQKPLFDGMGSKRLQNYESNRRQEIRAKKHNGWDYWDHYKSYGANYPVTHYKQHKKHIDRDDRFNPELYHKISEKSMQKYGIHRINEKNSTAKKRKQGDRWGGEKNVFQ